MTPRQIGVYVRMMTARAKLETEASPEDSVKRTAQAADLAIDRLTGKGIESPTAKQIVEEMRQNGTSRS